MASETLTITDNRTGKTYQIPIRDGAINALDLRQVRVSEDDLGLGFRNVAAGHEKGGRRDGRHVVLLLGVRVCGESPWGPLRRCRQSGRRERKLRVGRHLGGRDAHVRPGLDR